MHAGTELRGILIILAIALCSTSSATQSNEWVVRADSVLFADPYEAYNLYRVHSPKDHLRIAQSLLALGEIDSAVAHLKASGDSFSLGRAYFLKGDLERAYRAVSELESPRAQLLAGICKEETEPGHALIHFDRARRELPEIRGFLSLRMAKSLANLGRAREAFSVLIDLIHTYPEMEERREVREELSRLYLAIDCPLLARKHLIVLLPEDYPRYRYSIALIEEDMNWSSEESFREVLWNYPKTVWALQSFEHLAQGDVEVEDYLYGAIAYSSFQAYAKARDWLEIYLTHRPDDGRARFELGMVQYNLRAYTDAYSEFSRVQGELRDEAIFYCGRCRERRGEMDEALSEYGRIPATSDEFPRASYYAGRLCEKLGRFDQATRIYRTLYRRRPDCPFSDQACFRTGFVLYSLHKLSEAADELRLFERLFPESPYLGAALYWLAKSAPDPKEREAVLGRLIEVDPLGYYANIACANFGIPLPELETEKPLPLPDSLTYPAMRKGLLLLEIGLVQEAHQELRLVGSEQSSLLSAICNRYPLTSKAIGYAYRAGGETLKLLYPRTHIITLRRVSQTPLLMLALVREESRFDPFAISPAGAIGLAQIMPSTGASIADELGYEAFRTDDLFEPETNLLFGAFYLDKMLTKFGRVEYALAAYNAGPHRVTEWLSGSESSPLDEFVEKIPFSETRTYTKRVLASHWNYARIYGTTFAPPPDPSER